MLGKVNTANYTREQLQPIVSFLNTHMVHLDLHEVSPTPTNIIARADRVRRTAPLKYLIIDPYLFMEMETGRYSTETQAIKAMLTQMQAWGRNNNIWVIIVAHPRSLKSRTEKRTGRHRYVHHFGKCQLGQSRRFHLFHLPNQRTGPELHPTRYAESSRPRPVPDGKRTVCSSDLRTLR